MIKHVFNCYITKSSSNGFAWNSELIFCENFSASGFAIAGLIESMIRLKLEFKKPLEITPRWDNLTSPLRVKME
jgi:hypothetical protein